MFLTKDNQKEIDYCPTYKIIQNDIEIPSLFEVVVHYSISKKKKTR